MATVPGVTYPCVPQRGPLFLIEWLSGVLYRLCNLKDREVAFGGDRDALEDPVFLIEWLSGVLYRLCNLKDREAAFGGDRDALEDPVFLTEWLSGVLYRLCNLKDREAAFRGDERDDTRTEGGVGLCNRVVLEEAGDRTTPASL
jgi:hypothetical protein